MISGTVRKAWWQTGHPMETANPSGVRSDAVHVDFPSGKFNAAPKVEVMLSSIDIEQSANPRLTVSAANVTAVSFDLVITTQGDSKVYGIQATWIAYIAE